MGTINFTQILSATLVLLSIIDIVGSIPIILQLREKAAMSMRSKPPSTLPFSWWGSITAGTGCCASSTATSTRLLQRAVS